MTIIVRSTESIGQRAGAARCRNAAGPSGAADHQRRTRRRRFPRSWCSATAGKTPASTWRPPSRPPRKQKFPCTPWPSARPPRRPRFVSATWLRRRVYPGDAFQVTGYLQSQGLNGRAVTVELSVLNTGREGSNAEPALEKSRACHAWRRLRNRACAIRHSRASPPPAAHRSIANQAAS